MATTEDFQRTNTAAAFFMSHNPAPDRTELKLSNGRSVYVRAEIVKDADGDLEQALGRGDMREDETLMNSHHVPDAE